MAFGKTIGAEALNLRKAARGEIAVVAFRGHALDHLRAERMDRADALEGRHGAAQLVGLRRREACANNGDLHRLLLKQRHAERLAEHGLQLFRWIGDGFKTLPAAQIGCTMSP